jgi:pyruvate oxidase
MSDQPVKSWLCTVCGYIHQGEQPPESCPLCGAPASEFEEIKEKAPQASEQVTRDHTVSDIMVETMINWGIKCCFGMVGHSNLGLADALRRQTVAGNMHFYGVRHEGAAAFAASAYAKLTGKPAACLAIAGPGATNLLTGLWDAHMDRMPILALTGQIDTQVLGPGAFQEVDLSSAFSSVAAWSRTVLSSSNHTELMNLACKHAIVQRGVGHLIFPNEVQTLPAPEDSTPSSPRGRLGDNDIRPSLKSLEQSLALLKDSGKPVIIVGHGARFHMDSVIRLAEKLNAPVITTFKAKGLIRDSHPLACGVLGRSGTLVGSHFMNTADVLLVLGASFSQHTGITTNCPTIQVDFDPIALGKSHPITVPVYGAIGPTTELMLEALQTSDLWPCRKEEIREKWTAWREEKQNRAAKEQGKGISSAALFDKLSTLIPADAVIALDVGNNTYSFGRYFECKRQSVLMSGYLGSIGFGYPAALGAWAAQSQRPIFAITGDGGFGQYLGEMCTAVKYKMNITHILLNNSELGKISNEQRNANFDIWETSLKNPDFAGFAQNCGALGLRVEKLSELDDALRKAAQYDGPALIEVHCDPELI